MEKIKKGIFIINKQFLQLVKRRKVILLVLILLPLTTMLLSFLQIYTPKLIIDVISTDFQFSKSFLNIVSILLGMSILSIINKFFITEIQVSCVQMRSIKFTELNEYVQNIPYKYFEQKVFNDELNSAYESIASPDGYEGVFHNTIESIKIIFLIIFLFMFINSINPLVWFVFLLISVFIAAVSFVHVDFLSELDREESRQRRVVSKYAQISASYDYGKDIRQYKIENLMITKFKTKYDSLIEVIKKRESKKESMDILRYGLIYLRNILSLGILFYIFKMNEMSISTLVFYFGVIFILIYNMDKLVFKIRDLVTSCIISNKYYSFITKYKDVVNIAAIDEVRKTIYKIELKDVCFKYPNNKAYTVNHFNLTLNKGESVGIVGDNGVGKTTLFKLLTRFYEPTSGCLIINDERINDEGYNSYIHRISSVFQDVQIYATTILDNITCSDSADLVKVDKIIDSVELTNFIKSLPAGVHTELRKEIDENGIELSGGQKQKISIARSLYKEADVLFFDEATSSLDLNSEYKIIKEIIKDKDKILLFISHNLSNMKLLDRIIFIDETGFIAEQGSHVELMAMKGKYSAMFEKQASYFNDGIHYEN